MGSDSGSSGSSTSRRGQPIDGDGSGLENRRSLTGRVGSTPTLSATCEHDWDFWHDISFVTQTDGNMGVCVKMMCKKCGVTKHTNPLCVHA